jgi:hypothetical protein
VNHLRPCIPSRCQTNTTLRSGQASMQKWFNIECKSTSSLQKHPYLTRRRLGPGFPCLIDEYSSRYFRFFSMSWNFKSVDGLRMTAARLMWCGLRNSDQKPSSIRSIAVRLGARCRDRLTISSCCFMSRLSATMALAPPGPISLGRVLLKGG